jgi:polygalacturonase
MTSAVATYAAYAASVPPLATGDTRSVSQPVYPAVCTTLSAKFTTSQRSSPPSSDDTSRIQAALNSCGGTGKSVVLAASGSNNAFYTGALTMNGQALVVNSGVTLFGNNSYTSSSQLISVTGTNAAIMGPGTIDGRGDLVSSSGTPRLINATNVFNFIVINVTLKNAAKMHLYVESGNGFTAWAVQIHTPATTKNTDGIDIDSFTNATVNGCFVEDGDDGIVIKTNTNGASNITIKNNTLHGTHGLSIGSQTMFGVTNVLWTNNTVFGTDEFGNVSTDNNGIRIKSDQTCGGSVKQVTFTNTCMTGVKHLIQFNTHYGTCSGNSGIPVFTDIVVNGVKSVNSQSGAFSKFNGFDSSHLLGITLENISLDNTGQSGNQDASVGLFNSNLTPTGTGVTTFSVTGSGSVPTCTF